MSQRNIVAWTAIRYDGHYPPFVSINETDQGVDIQVRDPKSNHALATVTKAEWNELRRQIIERGEV